MNKFYTRNYVAANFNAIRLPVAVVKGEKICFHCVF